jgi:Flp pilus assembly CpaF family ATPase
LCSGVIANIGLPGMGTLHANSAREVVVKRYTLTLLAGGEHRAPIV